MNSDKYRYPNAEIGGVPKNSTPLSNGSKGIFIFSNWQGTGNTVHGSQIPLTNIISVLKVTMIDLL